MIRERLSRDRLFLDSRVARRVFLGVAACAFLPIATFAAFAYYSVGRQLESDAAEALRGESKAAGMGILERLLLADEAFVQQLAAPPAEGDASLGRALRGMQRVAAADVAPDLDAKAREHLRRGASVLRVSPRDEGARIVLLRRDAGTDALWRAEVEPTYVFDGALRFSGDAFWVLDAREMPLSTSLPRDAIPTAGAAADEDARIRRADVSGRPSLVARWPLFLAGPFAAEGWTVSVARPLESVQGPLRQFETLFPWIVGITLCCAMGLALFQVRRTLVPVSDLMQGARRVAVGDFAARVEIHSRDEFGYLSEAFNEMADVIERHVEVLSTVNRIGAALSAQEDTPALLDLILRGAMEVTDADGGVLLLWNDRDELEISRLQLRRLDPGAPGRPQEAFPLEAAQRCRRERVTERTAGITGEGAQELESWRAFGRHLGAPVASWLGLPLRDERGEALGVLVLVSTSRHRFDPDACELAESLASQAAVAMRKNGLVESFRALFEGLIQLTVRAVDEKSAHTGDHCRKVPILTELIADALCAAQSGPFKDFDLTPDERYELRIAALLHDCGKVVTPVHVLDKATKMETIWDRIELVSTRFEVLRRDALLRALERRVGVDARAVAADDAELARELAALEDERAFLVRSNIGSEEGMPESDRQRVRDIATRRRFEEATGQTRDVLDAEEVTQLTIPRGTLTAEERLIIESHVDTTIGLLEELPFPRNLRRVPEIAGAHHERVDGTGYPNRLQGDQLGMQARIVGLADVFEALTARDRPYKPGRTLGETLEILDRLCDEGHLDRELYAFFLQEGLHLRYAAEHVAPEQIDPDHWEAIERLTGPETS